MEQKSLMKWRLVRMCYDYKEYPLKPGENKIGRGNNNDIVFFGLTVSRQHCVVSVNDEGVSVKDLGSINGTYVDRCKLIPDEPTALCNNNLISIGWLDLTDVTEVEEKDRFIFRLVGECISPEINVINIDEDLNKYSFTKRKLSPTVMPKVENASVIDLSSDTDEENSPKKIKIEANEYFADDVAIQVDSDSDSENEVWFQRLSQSSPGKALKEKYNEKASSSNVCSNNNNEEEDSYSEDLIQLQPPPSPVVILDDDDDDENECDGTIERSIHSIPEAVKVSNLLKRQKLKMSLEKKIMIIDTKPHEPKKINARSSPSKKTNVKSSPSKKTNDRSSSRKKNKSKSKTMKTKNNESNHISKHSIMQLKEERKQKLKELAIIEIEKHNVENKCSKDNGDIKQNVAAKVTTRNRGAFLTEVPLPMKPSNKQNNKSSGNQSPKMNNNDRKTSSKSSENKNKKSQKTTTNVIAREVRSKSLSPEVSKVTPIIINKNAEVKERPESIAPTKIKEVRSKSLSPEVSKVTSISIIKNAEEKEPTKSIAPTKLNKVKKSVVFSSEPPQVREFQIEVGNDAKSIKNLRSTLIDIQQKATCTISQKYLKKILCWSPNWLNEQNERNEPPPILRRAPKHLLDKFHDHSQYVQILGDLMLLEIWDCLTEANSRIKYQNATWLEMELASEPVLPCPDRGFDFFHLTAQVKIPRSEIKSAPKTSDVMVIMFGEDNQQKFFYVQNVKIQPIGGMEELKNCTLSLHALSTKMTTLKKGQTLKGKILAAIKNEIQMFEAMEYLQMTPLCNAIIRPTPALFERVYNKDIWTNIHKYKCNADLNESQLNAVKQSVSIALGDKPAIQMVQGPPGTGKSRVICSIVMSYFYDAAQNYIQGRKKILICATSNAAVDELVIRLLNIRQGLKQGHRFRMVRVGRQEAMHERARVISSETLAERDLRRRENSSTLDKDEIRLFEAKLNMWNFSHAAAVKANDDARRVYCEERIKQYMTKKLGCNKPQRSRNLFATERTMIECADIIVSTLSSAGNAKMKGLKGRIGLCIIDEAAQAIEPMGLMPLTLDVDHITLIGDQEQLPGYICSRRAKSYGLSGSLFSRLVSVIGQSPDATTLTLLDQQYRMHPAIAEYPNHTFYEGRIKNSAEIRHDLLSIPAYSMIAIQSRNNTNDISGSHTTEAWGVARLALAMYNIISNMNLSIAIITPYNAQKELLKQILQQIKRPNEPVLEVDTVDSFQGQERDIVLISLARSSGAGFLTDTGRLNVMLTRAKHSLVICLNPKALASNPQWRTLIDDANRRGVYKNLPESECHPEAKRDDTILRYLNS